MRRRRPLSGPGSVQISSRRFHRPGLVVSIRLFADRLVRLSAFSAEHPEADSGFPFWILRRPGRREANTPDISRVWQNRLDGGLACGGVRESPPAELLFQIAPPPTNSVSTIALSATSLVPLYCLPATTPATLVITHSPIVRCVPRSMVWTAGLASGVLAVHRTNLDRFNCPLLSSSD
jgi:hypothetical protein